MIGSDKVHLSLPIVIPQENPLYAVETSGTVPAADGALAPRTLAEYVAAAAADNTRKAYQNDLRAFIAWGAVLPLPRPTKSRPTLSRMPRCSHRRR